MHTRRTYNPILGWQLILAFTLSGLGAYWTFVVARHFQFSLVPALVVSVTSFFMALTQIKYLVGHVLVLVDQNARRALFHEPVVTSVYRNRSIHPGVEPTESLTIMVPIYNEGFDVIRHSSMDSARREVTNYGPGANLLVLDDGLMVFANNDIEGFERQARETPTPQRTRAQREVLERLTFYREMLARPAVRFGVVARPRPVPGHPETARRGTFKKGSNLNFAHRLFDRMQAIAARPGSDGATVETALGQLLGPSRRWTYVGGEIFIGEIVLLLDKDSAVPEGVSREAVPDFGEDATLAYIQSVTSPSNPGVNFFTRMIGYYTGLLYEVAFPMATLLGATVPLVGHNAFIRTVHLRAHGYWREDRASEDLSFELDAAAAGLHGKYLDVTKFTFQEAVCLDIEEELRRVSRYAFGAAEIVAHPIRDWRRYGVLTGQLKALLRSPHVPRRVKVDKLAYLQVYFNRLLLLPLVICSGFWPVYHLGILGVCVGVVFTASYAAGVWVGMRGRRGNGAESYSTVAHRHFGYSILYRMNVLSSAYVTVRSLIQYFLSLSPEHPVSPVEGGGEAADREVSKEMVAALVRASVLSGVFAIGAVWGYWHGIPRVERWLSYYAFLNLVLGPFLLSPRFVGMLRHRLSSRRCFG